MKEELIKTLVARGVPELKARLAYDLSGQAAKKGLDAIKQTAALADTKEDKALVLLMALISLSPSVEKAKACLPALLSLTQELSQ